MQPALHRLNRVLRPRPPLEVQDLANLAELCAYDSQARGTEFGSWSEWCHLFDRDEWDVLGYAKEVGRWYQVGQGSVSRPRDRRAGRRPQKLIFSGVWPDHGCTF